MAGPGVPLPPSADRGPAHIRPHTRHADDRLLRECIPRIRAACTSWALFFIQDAPARHLPGSRASCGTSFSFFFSFVTVDTGARRPLRLQLSDTKSTSLNYEPAWGDLIQVMRISDSSGEREREFFIDSLLVRIHFVIEMILGDRPRAMGVLNSLFQAALHLPSQDSFGDPERLAVRPRFVPACPKTCTRHVLHVYKIAVPLTFIRLAHDAHLPRPRPSCGANPPSCGAHPPSCGAHPTYGAHPKP